MKNFLVIFCIINLLVIVACQSPSGEKQVQQEVVPSFRVIVDLPKTLLVTTDPAFSPNVSRSSASTANISYAYRYLKSVSSNIQTLSSIAAAERIEFSEIIAQNHLLPSSTVQSGLKLTLSQALIDRILAALCESLRSSVAMPAVQEVTFPDFIYNRSSNAFFDYQLTWVTPTVITSTSSRIGGTHSLYWNENGNRFGISNPDGAGGTEIVCYDDATQSSFMKLSRPGVLSQSSIISTTSFKFKSDPSNSGNKGTWFDISYTNGIDTTSTVSGYGDDQGGVISILSTTPSSGYSLNATEAFAGSGNITYQNYTLNYSSTLVQQYQFGVGVPAVYVAKQGATDYGIASTLIP